MSTLYANSKNSEWEFIVMLPGKIRCFPLENNMVPRKTMCFQHKNNLFSYNCREIVCNKNLVKIKIVRF